MVTTESDAFFKAKRPRFAWFVCLIWEIYQQTTVFPDSLILDHFFPDILILWLFEKIFGHFYNNWKIQSCANVDVMRHKFLHNRPTVFGLFMQWPCPWCHILQTPFQWSEFFTGPGTSILFPRAVNFMGLILKNAYEMN